MEKFTKAERALMSAAPVKWRKMVDKLLLDAPMANATSDVISEQAVGLVRLAAYIDFRYNRYNASHEQAVAASNKAAKAVRKALGFAYPQDDLEF